MTPFAFLDVRHQLEVVDRGSTTFRSEHDFVIKANQPSRFFIRDYWWSGSGVEKEYVPNLISDIDVWGFPNHRIHGPLLVEGDSRIVVVDLGRTITAGEIQTVRFRHKMKDLNRTFKPLFEVKPSRQIQNSISFRVILPEWKNLQMIYRKFTHDTEKVVESSLLEPSDSQNGSLTFDKELLNPGEQNMGHRLVWSYDTEG